MLRKLIAAALLCVACTAADAQSTTVPTTNSSTTITAGNSFQTVLATITNPLSRRSLTIQNNNTNGDNCWIFIGSAVATKATSILLGQGGSYQRYAPYVPSDAIQITCATTSDSIYVDIQ